MLKPSPPVRQSFVNNFHFASGTGGAVCSGVNSGSASSSANTSANGISGGGTPTRKIPPTYEEDALVLRVIESYCAAYQNTNRNTTHSGESRLPLFSHPTWRTIYARRR